jgi:hypothetical protein
MARSFVYLCAPLCPAAPLLRPRFLSVNPFPGGRGRGRLSAAWALGRLARGVPTGRCHDVVTLTLFPH